MARIKLKSLCRLAAASRKRQPLTAGGPALTEKETRFEFQVSSSKALGFRSITGYKS
jgi:hypothetical protein